jgi:hypothetical protein
MKTVFMLGIWGQVKENAAMPFVNLGACKNPLWLTLAVWHMLYEKHSKQAYVHPKIAVAHKSAFVLQQISMLPEEASKMRSCQTSQPPKLQTTHHPVS